MDELAGCIPVLSRLAGCCSKFGNVAADDIAVAADRGLDSAALVGGCTLRSRDNCMRVSNA